MSTHEKKSGLTKRMAVILVILALLAMVQTMFTQAFTNWAGFREWIPFPMIISIAFFYLLGRANKSWKLSVQEYAVLFVGSFLIANTFTWGYYMSGSYGPTALIGIGQVPAIWAATQEPFKSRVAMYIPSWIAPTSASALNGVWFGGAMDWGAWLPSIAFWSAFLILITIWQLCWGFFLRKPLVETERLAFPGIAVGAYLVAATKEEDGKMDLFNFSRGWTKLFWAAFVLGFLLTFLDTLKYFVPSIPGSSYLGIWNVDLSPYTKDLLPGAYFFNQVRVTDILIFMFAPMDALLTIVVGWVALMVLYPTIAVRLGWVTYSPGMETGTTGYQALSQNTGPFKYGLLVTIGVPIGMGLWMIWQNRAHFAEIFRAGFGTTSGPREEEGVSYRTVTYGAVITSIIILALMIVLGAPIQSAIVFLALELVFSYGQVRAMGDVHEYNSFGYYMNWYRFDSGLWGLPPVNSAAMFNSMFMYTAFDSSATRIQSYPAMHHTFKTYKVGQLNDTSAKSMFDTVLLTIVPLAIFASAFSIWFFHNFGGISKLATVANAWAPGTADEAYRWTITTPIFNIGGLERYTLLIGGALLSIVIYIARMNFPWFFLNPSGLIILGAAPYIGVFAAVIALAIKYVVLRVGGTKLFENSAVPFVVGFLVGYGVNAAIVGALATFMIGLPKILV
jgi:hypothetical protein